MRAIGVDWSGARSEAVQRSAIWTAEAVDGELRSLTAGRTRAETVDHLLAVLDDGTPAVVGLDFCFGFPGWWAAGFDARDGSGMWDVTSREGESWLDVCPPPFWGRPGRPRPRDERPAFRRTELETPPGVRRPKSVFQIGGAGAVGTGSIRGMPALARLRRVGVPIWPFDPWPSASAVVVEAYPRWCTGNVVKRHQSARSAHLRRAWPALRAEHYDLASASEDAFDAACTALTLSLTPPPDVVTDGIDAIEGRVMPVVCRPVRPGYRTAMTDGPTDPQSLEQRLAAMEQRLQGLEKELAAARADAKEVLPRTDEPTFAETGDVHPELTDDAIAPPG